MKSGLLIILFLLSVVNLLYAQSTDAWIRINALGYSPDGVKTGIFASKSTKTISDFKLVDAVTNKTAFKGKAGKGIWKLMVLLPVLTDLIFLLIARVANIFLKAGDIVRRYFR
jgi:hypothetical protein